jgi:hypothetical protein
MVKEFLLQDGESIYPKKKEPNWKQGLTMCVCVERGDRNVVQERLFKHVHTVTS